ncbi:hypothetical protein HD554DRAFT_2196012 [Boletus coccyginus]|nr:hypothetical protein HD554DRAFT_2196012 [Boletus coccyginus]
MAPLSEFQLPLPPDGPPPGYRWKHHPASQQSTTTAFKTRIDQRDTFLGRPRCVVCGLYDETVVMVQHCHISMRSEPGVWTDLKDRNWIPALAKDHPEHEPRNGLLMCATHHQAFDHYSFFIRYFPEICKFVFINYSGTPLFQQFHGKAIALDDNDRHAPFPSLFILHEMRVRGFHPFQPTNPDIPDDITWQDWIISDGLLSDKKGTFHREPQKGNRNTQITDLHMTPITRGGTPGPSGGKRTLALTSNTIHEILEATRSMPSWKECQKEGMSWNGTADENVERYISCIGVHDRD